MTTTDYRLRTQEEIVAEVARTLWEGKDIWGNRTESLVGALTFEHAEPFITAEPILSHLRGPNAVTWRPYLTADEIAGHAVSYLDFAWMKAKDHRGLTAGRSVDKMRTFLWLLGLDEEVKAFDAAPYPCYGGPKLKIAALALDAGLPVSESLVNMMAGKPCHPMCDEGCKLGLTTNGDLGPDGNVAVQVVGGQRPMDWTDAARQNAGPLLTIAIATKMTSKVTVDGVEWHYMVSPSNMMAFTVFGRATGGTNFAEGRLNEAEVIALIRSLPA